MKAFRLLFALFLAASLSALAQPGHAQKLQFAKTFDMEGHLVDRDSVFKYQTPHIMVAVKYTGTTPLPEELYIIVRDIDGTHGRFLMKRSNKNAREANGLIRLQNEGIFRVYLYDPNLRNLPLAYSRLYATGVRNPTREALITAQRNILIQRGVIPGNPVASNQRTATTTPTRTQTATQTTTQPAAQTHTQTQSTARAATTSNTNTTASASGTASQAAAASSSTQESDDFEVGSLDEGLDDMGGGDEDFGTTESALDSESMDDDLGGMDLDLQGMDDTGGDFGGDFESFDDMDDGFEFEISDF